MPWEKILQKQHKHLKDAFSIRVFRIDNYIYIYLNVILLL